VSNFIGGIIFIILGLTCILSFSHKDNNNIFGQFYNVCLGFLCWKPGSLSYKWAVLGVGIQLIIIGLLIVIL
jgi:hypothetical protein